MANPAELASEWERLARSDPMWAILARPDMRGRRWDAEEFFETGQTYIDSLVGRLGSLSVVPSGRALDFGCGVGRLSRAMARHWDEVVGVDIAPSMIEQARRLNGVPSVSFVWTQGDDLEAFGDSSFDTVLAILVLQHMVPSAAERYLREFFRVLRPGGVAIFDLPSGFTRSRRGLRVRALKALPGPADRLLRTVFRRPPRRIWDHDISVSRVRALIAASGGELLDREQTVDEAFLVRQRYIATLRS